MSDANPSCVPLGATENPKPKKRHLETTTIDDIIEPCDNIAEKREPKKAKRFEKEFANSHYFLWDDYLGDWEDLEMTEDELRLARTSTGRRKRSTRTRRSRELSDEFLDRYWQELANQLQWVPEKTKRVLTSENGENAKLGVSFGEALVLRVRVFAYHEFEFKGKCDAWLAVCARKKLNECVVETNSLVVHIPKDMPDYEFFNPCQEDVFEYWTPSAQDKRETVLEIIRELTDSDAEELDQVPPWLAQTDGFKSFIASSDLQQSTPVRYIESH